MNRTFALWIILCVLFHMPLTVSWDENDLEEVMSLLRSVLDFVNSNYKNLTRDLNFSPRMDAGQLGMLLGRIKRGSLILSPSHSNTISYLKRYADEITSKALPYTIANHKEMTLPYLDLCNENFWIWDHETQDVDILELDMIKDTSDMNEACLFGALGTGEYQTKCNITDKCWDYLTAKGLINYSASHQVLHIIIAQTAGCFTGTVRQTTDQIAKHVCSNMLLENFKDFYTAEKSEYYFDILFERIAFCGMFGFHQFARPEWLAEGLKYRRPDFGCWNVQLYNETAADQSHSMTKRNELIEGGCESHSTAVAMDALTQFVRYIVEDLNSDERHQAPSHFI